MKRPNPAKRGDYLINWFLSVFDGRKAPYPKHAFHGLAHHMREHLARNGSAYRAKYKRKDK